MSPARIVNVIGGKAAPLAITHASHAQSDRLQLLALSSRLSFRATARDDSLCHEVL
jgi:hypothetical protein